MEFNSFLGVFGGYQVMKAIETAKQITLKQGLLVRTNSIQSSKNKGVPLSTPKALYRWEMFAQPKGKSWFTDINKSRKLKSSSNISWLHVLLCICESGQLCAIKEVRVVCDDQISKECLKQLNQEINLLNQLSHPNIVQYYRSDLGEEALYVYLEYVSGEELLTVCFLPNLYMAREIKNCGGGRGRRT